MAFDMDIYEFDEKIDLTRYQCWVLGATFYPPPWTPLFTDLWYAYGRYGMQYGPEMMCDVGSHGWDWRIKDGAFYITIDQTSDEEKKAREPMWRERIGAVLDDPWKFWEDLKAELKQAYDHFIPFDVERASDIELNIHFWDVWHFTKRMSEIHFYAMYALGQGNGLFRIVFPELTGIAITDAKFAKLMSGYDNALFQANKGLAALATRAVKLGLKGLFDTSRSEELLSALEKSQAGREWLKEFQEYLKVYGLRMTRQLEIATPTWQEKPSLAITEVKRAMAAGGVDIPEMQRERLVQEREEMEREVLAMVPGEQREWFEKLMRCTQASHFYSEDHAFWCEFLGLSLVRRASMALGKRFARAGIMDQYDDTLYLLHHEIAHAAIIQDRIDLHPVVKRRKEEYEGYLKKVPEMPMIIGDPSKLMGLVAADTVFSVAVAPQVATPEEVGATVVGAAGAPGVVEGIARVIMSDAEIDKIQPGDILVTPFTTPAWTPVFSTIKAVVTDGGGYLAHAAIVGREYGIPAVVGTMEASRKIKTGDKLRVDGNLLRVYVL